MDFNGHVMCRCRFEVQEDSIFDLQHVVVGNLERVVGAADEVERQRTAWVVGIVGIDGVRSGQQSYNCAVIGVLLDLKSG